MSEVPEVVAAPDAAPPRMSDEFGRRIDGLA